MAFANLLLEGDGGVHAYAAGKPFRVAKEPRGAAEGSNGLNVTREAALVAYRAFSDVAGKGAFFLVTVLAARRLSQAGFGIFSLGTTSGWMAAGARGDGQGAIDSQGRVSRHWARSPRL